MSGEACQVIFQTVARLMPERHRLGLFNTDCTPVYRFKFLRLVSAPLNSLIAILLCANRLVVVNAIILTLLRHFHLTWFTSVTTIDSPFT